MAVSSFPSTIGDLTASWLSATLKQTISEFTAKRIGETTGYVSELYRISWEDSTAPEISSVVIKLPSSVGVSSDIYQTEIDFYRFLNRTHSSAGLEYPHCYFVEATEDFKSFIVVLEDCKEPYAVGNITKGLTCDEANEALRQIAGFHACWWDKKESSGIEKVSKPLIELWGNALGLCWDNGAKEVLKTNGILTEEVEVTTNFLSKYVTAIQTKERTLIHGDFRADNVMVWRSEESTTRPLITIDFQLLHWGNPMEDVAYLLSSGVPIENLSENQDAYLRCYYDELVSLGVDDYSFEQCLFDYREQLVYCILMPCLAAMDKTPEDNKTEVQKEQLKTAIQWRERVCAAITLNKCTEIIEKLIESYAPFLSERAFPELEKGIASFVEFFTKAGPVDWPNRSVEEYREIIAAMEKPLISRMPAKESGILSMTSFPAVADCPELKVFIPEEISNHDVILFISSTWVAGFNIDEENWRRTCKDSNSIVVAVHHCHAPEKKQNNITNDYYKVLHVLLEHPERYGIESSSKKFSLLGNRQGAHIAVCLMRDLIEKGEDNLISQLILLFPWLDPTCSSESYEQIGNSYNNLIGTNHCKWFWNHYASSPLEEFKNTENPLIFSESVLKKFPRTLILTAEFDVTKDEGHQFYEMLDGCGVHVDIKMFEQAIFIMYSAYLPQGQEAMNLVGATLKK